MKTNTLILKILMVSGLLWSCKGREESPDPSDNSSSSGGLLAYFSFDDADCQNISGTESSGTAKGDATFTDGKKGLCLLLDGSGDYVALGRGYNLSDEFTVLCWINPDEIGRSDAAIFAKYETNHYGPYDFYLHHDHPAFWISDGNGSYKTVYSKSKIKAKEWTHLTWVGSGKKIKLYINGILDAEETIPAMTTRNDLVTIGRQALLFTNNGSLEFKGKIDELKIYGRALDDVEVKRESE